MKTSLLSYVIDYLDEERSRLDMSMIELVDKETVLEWVKQAIDAYEGGAR